jgi:hypothetical protein
MEKKVAPPLEKKKVQFTSMWWVDVNFLFGLEKVVLLPIPNM